MGKSSVSDAAQSGFWLPKPVWLPERFLLASLIGQELEKLAGK